MWKFQQEDWAAQEFKQTELMDPLTLADKSLQIIYWNLQEDIANDLLATAGAFIPGIGEYARFKTKNEADTLFINKRTALKALSDYIGEKDPGSVLHLTALYYQQTAESDINYNEKEWENLFEVFGDIISRDPSVEKKALLALAKCENLNYRINHEGLRSEKDYLDRVSIEQEAMNAYPPDNKDNTLTKALLYYSLAELKNIGNDDFLDWIYTRETSDSYVPFCRIKGNEKLYASNSDAYYKRAKEIALNLLSPGHPIFRTIANNHILYSLGEEIVDPAVFNELKEICEFAIYYYPPYSWEGAYWNIVHSIYNPIESGAADWELERDINLLELYLGPGNILSVEGVKQFALSRPMVTGDSAFWETKLNEQLHKAGLTQESSSYLFYLISNILSNYDGDQETVTRKLEEIEKLYQTYHEPNMISIETGKKLSQFYIQMLGNKEKATDLMQIALKDLEKTLTKPYENHPLWWRYYIQNEALKVYLSKDFKEMRKYYTDLLSKVNKLEDKQLAGKLKYYLLSDQYNYVTDVERNHSAGLPLLKEMQRYGSSLIPFNDFVTEGLLAYSLAESSNDITKDRKAIHTHIDKALSVAQEAKVKGEDGRILITDYTPLTAALIILNEPEKALDITNIQTEKYKEQYGENFSSAYMDICVWQASILERLNRKVEARRIMDRVMQQMKTSPTQIIVTPMLLDCLWEDYYMARNQNGQNLGNYLLKFQDIIQATNILSNNPETMPDVKVRYLSKFLTETLYLLGSMYEDFDNTKKTGTEEEIKIINQFLEMNNFTQVEPYISQVEKLWQEHGLDLKNNSDYVEFLASVASYQFFAKKDEKAALKSIKELLDNYTLSTNSKKQLISLQGHISYNVGDMDMWGNSIIAQEELLAQDPIPSIYELFNLQKNLAHYYILKNNYEKAHEYARAYYNKSKEVLDGNFRLMTTAEQNNYLESNGDPSMLLCGILQYLPDSMEEEVYDGVIYRTGIQLRSQRATRRAIDNCKDPYILSLIDSLNTIKQKSEELKGNLNLSIYYTQKSDKDSTNEYWEMMRVSNLLEREILDAVIPQNNSEIRDIHWREIRDKLREDEAAIEFLYSDKNVMALVLRKDFEKPKAVILGLQDDLWNLIHSQNRKNSASLAKKLYPEYSRTFYDMLWLPIEPYLAGVKTVYHTAPGILSTVAFNAFTDHEGKALFDKYDLNQLTTTAQLIFDPQNEKIKSVAMMGNILYSPTQKPLSRKEAKTRNFEDEYSLLEEEEPGSDRGINRFYFRHLPYTVDEINDVAEIFSAEKVDSVQLYNATEAKLREMAAGKPDLLHLATHGFFINDWQDAVKLPFYKNRNNNSMNRSGFALSGAEDTWKGISRESEDNNGIMTAEEVSMLDLSGIQLVTLSACETALGDYNFEGVYGLQRGFKQAGVQSMLLSLWSVNDESTSVFMKSFYDTLQKGEGKQKAWRTAVDTVRAQYPEPIYWAPFILLDGR